MRNSTRFARIPTVFRGLSTSFGPLAPSRIFFLAAALLLLLSLLFLPLDHEWSSRARMAMRSAGSGFWIQEALRIVRPLGKGLELTALALLLGGIKYRRRAAQALLALLLSAAFVWPIKVAVSRPRPNGDDRFSFPSGDSASIAAWAVPWMMQSARAAPPAIGLIAAVSAARTLDGKHFPADVMAGAALGLAAGALAASWKVRERRLPTRKIWLLAAFALVLLQRTLQLLLQSRSPLLRDFLLVVGPAALLLGLSVFIRPAARRFVRATRDPVVTSRAAYGAVFLLSFLTLAAYFLVAASSTLWDRDEPRFARATVEMLRSGQYLYPTFNGTLRPDKPILVYWLMSLPIRWFGQTELACRFFAPLATLGTGLLTALLGRRLIGSWLAGAAAMGLLISSPLMVVSGTAATTDAVLLFFVAAAVTAFAMTCSDGWRPSHAFLLALSLAGALLTKGPVGLIPLLIMGAVLALARALPQRKTGFLIGTTLALIAALALFLAWAVPANLATEGRFFNLGIGRHVVARSLRPMEGHGGRFWTSLPYYVPVVWLAFFPWTLYLPAAWSALAGHRLGRPGLTPFLCGWMLAPLALMTLVATKLPHYVLPAWPALALAVAALLEAHRQGDLSARDLIWMRRGLWLFVPAGLLVATALLIGSWLAPIPGARVAGTGIGLLVLAMTLTVWHEHRRSRWFAGAATLFTGMLLLQIAVSMHLLPALEPFKISPRLARAVRAKTPASVPVSTRSYGEPSLNFYLDRGPLEVLPSDEAVAAWARRPGRGVLIIPTGLLRHLERHFGSFGLEPITSVYGFNYSRGEWIEIAAMLRNPEER